MSTERRRMAIFAPRISDRPFLLELLGVILILAGGFATLNALIGIFKMFVSGAEPGFGLQNLMEDVSVSAALPVAYAIWKERSWARPALVAFALLNTVPEWIKSANVASVAGSVLTLAFISWYLYLWPNVTAYYRRLREFGKLPNPAPPADA